MAKLTIFKPDGYARSDKSTEDSFLKEEPVDLGVSVWQSSIEIYFLLPGRKATWWGKLHMTPDQAEKLKNQIDVFLNEFTSRVVIPEDPPRATTETKED